MSNAAPPPDVAARPIRGMKPAEVNPSELLAAQLAMASRSFRTVPLEPNGKRPLLTAWQREASKDPKVIEAWRKQWPTANYGVVADNHIFVDTDVKDGRPGKENRAKLDLPSTYTVETPTGGTHEYFKAAHPVANGSAVYGDGVDIRSGNGYVVGPGSVIDGGVYRVVSPMPIADAPECLLLRPAKEKETSPVNLGGIDLGRAAERFRDYLQRQTPVEQGSRNNECFKAACFGRDLGCDLNTVRAVMGEHWRCEPPLDDGEFNTATRSAFDNGQNEPGSKSAEAIEAATLAMFNPLPNEPKGEPETPKARLVDFWTAADVTTPDKIFDDYLIKGWLWKQTDAQMFGETNIGKTFVALDMAVNIAAGQPWFGCKVQQAGVMYLAFEGQKGLRVARLPALKRKYTALDWNKLPLMVVNCNAPLVDAKAPPDKTAGWVYLQEAIAGFKERYGAPPGLIIVDTYSRAIGGDTSDETLAIKFSQMAGSLLRDHGATVLRIHHPGHTNLGRGKGSSSIRQGVDSDINVTAGVIEAPKQRDAKATRLGFALDTVTVATDQDGEPLTTCVVKQAVIAVDLGLNDRQNGILEIVRSLAGRDGKVKRAAVYKASHDEGFIGSRSAFRDVLVALEKKQRIKFGRDVIQLHLAFDDLDGGDDA